MVKNVLGRVTGGNGRSYCSSLSPLAVLVLALVLALANMAPATSADSTPEAGGVSFIVEETVTAVNRTINTSATIVIQYGDGEVHELSAVSLAVANSSWSGQYAIRWREWSLAGSSGNSTSWWETSILLAPGAYTARTNATCHGLVRTGAVHHLVIEELPAPSAGPSTRTGAPEPALVTIGLVIKILPLLVILFLLFLLVVAFIISICAALKDWLAELAGNYRDGKPYWDGLLTIDPVFCSRHCSRFSPLQGGEKRQLVCLPAEQLIRRRILTRGEVRYFHSIAGTPRFIVEDAIAAVRRQGASTCQVICLFNVLCHTPAHRDACLGAFTALEPYLSEYLADLEQREEEKVRRVWDFIDRNAAIDARFDREDQQQTWLRKGRHLAVLIRQLEARFREVSVLVTSPLSAGIRVVKKATLDNSVALNNSDQPMMESSKPAAKQEEQPVAGDQQFPFDLVGSLPAVDDIYLAALSISRVQISIRKKKGHKGELTVPGSIRKELGITETTASVFIDPVKHAPTGYSLLRVSLTSSGTAACREVPLVKNRFSIPPEWRDFTLLVPGAATEFAIHRSGDVLYALIIPVVSRTYRTALLHPDPARLQEKQRVRDRSIKGGKNWLSPPPTLAVLEQEKKGLFARHPVTNRLLNPEAVKMYLASKRQVTDLIEQLCRQATDACHDRIDAVIDLCLDGLVTDGGTSGARTIGQHFSDLTGLSESYHLTLAGQAQAYLRFEEKLRGNLLGNRLTKNRGEQNTEEDKNSGKNGESEEEPSADSLVSWFRARPDLWHEFLVFQRSPFTEKMLARQWKIHRTFTRSFFESIRARLDQQLPREVQLGQPLSPFTEQGIKQACQTRITEVKQTIADLQEHGKDTRPSRAFLKKLETIESSAGEVVAFLNGCPLLGGPVITGWQPLRERSAAIARFLFKIHHVNYHSALRSVLSLAVAESAPGISHPLAVTLQGLRVEEELVAERCLVKPFKSTRRNTKNGRLARGKKNKLQPINLVMASKAVVFRPGDGLELTKRFHHYRAIELQVPRQARDRNPLSTFLPASHEMQGIIPRGARVQLLRLHPPDGPSRKVEVDVTFTGPAWAFAATSHLEVEHFCPSCWRKLPTGSRCKTCGVTVVPLALPRDKRVGVDLNRISKFVAAFSTGDPLSEESQLSRQTLAACDHYHAVRDELPVQQKVLDRRVKQFTRALHQAVPGITEDRIDEALDLTSAGVPLAGFRAFITALGCTGQVKQRLVSLAIKIRKISTQLTCLHRKQKNLRKAVHNLCTLEIAIQLLLTGATTLACELFDGLDTKDKKGALAIATLNMPANPAILYRAIRNINARYRQLGIPLKVSLDPVDPRGTSSIHTNCGGTLERSPGQWDMATCDKCGLTVNTHVNAAINIKFLSAGVPLGQPFPATAPPDPSPASLTG